MPEAAGELTIDESRDVRFLGSRPEIVGRNEPRNRGVDEAALGSDARAVDGTVTIPQPQRASAPAYRTEMAARRAVSGLAPAP